MDANQRQYDLILAQRLLPKSRLDKAFSHPDRRIYNDFCDFLIHSLILRADLALNIRQQASLPADVVQSPPHGSRRSPEELERLYHAKQLTEPLFSPHARSQFKLIEKLGEGGMGVVHRIEDRKLGRTAALKVLGTVNADERAVNRFVREARITASLVHPNIPPVYELGKNSSGEHYILMKVIEGQSLREAIREVHGGGDANPKEIRSLLEALVKVCEAMAYAHSKDVIHRDLKPENIMIGEFGEVMVLDWGLARDFSEDHEDDIALNDQESLRLREAAQKEGLTGAGDLLGTVGYMAPEQVDGEACKQSDVFALGAILTEILTGKPAISGEGVIAKLSATIRGRIKKPRQLLRSAPKELDALAREALEMKVENRLESSGVFAEELKAYLAGEELEVYRYGIYERSKRWWSRRPTLLVTTLLLTLLCSSGIYFYLKTERAERERIASEAAKEKAKIKKERMELSLKLFNDAENALDRGLPKEKLKKIIEKALDLGGRTDAQHIRAGRVYGQTQYFELAIKEFGFVDPNSVEALEALFYQHSIEMLQRPSIFESSNYVNQIIERSIELKVQNEFTHLARAIEFGARAKIRAAKRELKRSCEYSTLATRIFRRRGVMNSLANPELAIVDYDYAIYLDPNHAKTYFDRGVAKQSLGNLRDAIKDYDRAIALKAAPRYYLNRGASKLQLKEYRIAIEDFSMAITLNPDYKKAYLNRGNAYYFTSDYGRAKKDFLRAVELDESLAMPYYFLGEISYEEKNYERALVCYQKARRRIADSAQIFDGLGRSHLALNHLEQALLNFDQAIHYNPESSFSYSYRGKVKRLLKDYRGALEDMNKAIAIDPNRYSSFTGRGQILHLLGRSKEAAVDFERSLKINSEKGSVAEKRRFIQRYLGRPSKY